MKRIKKVIEDVSVKLKYDALGYYKNVAIIGQPNKLTNSLITSFDNSFNLFTLYNTNIEGEEERDLYFDRKYDVSTFNAETELEYLNEQFTEMKFRFDCIILVNDAVEKAKIDISDIALFEQENLKKARDDIEIDLLTYKLTQNHLKPDGAIISLIPEKNFNLDKDFTMNSVNSITKMHLKFLLSELKNLNYENRLYTFILQEEETLKNVEAYNNKLIGAIRNCLFNRKAPAANTFLDYKEEESGKLTFHYR